MMAIFAMVTTTRSNEYTAWALRTFFATTPLQPQDVCVLIDNDGGYRPAADCVEFPLEMVTHQTPLSFAENVNCMAQRALQEKTDLFFLNNDVIFTRNWFQSFQTSMEVILVPVSNREVEYNLPLANGGVFSCPMNMSLEEYLGHEHDFDRIVALHQERVSKLAPYLPMLCAPFFVVKIPHTILRKVGAMDVRYGVGGGEDYDYCLRAHRLGFSVAFAQRSFLLHFGSKSIANPDVTTKDPEFVQKFQEKWGERAARLIFPKSAGVFKDLGLRAYDFHVRGFNDLIEELCGPASTPDYIPL